MGGEVSPNGSGSGSVTSTSVEVLVKLIAWKREEHDRNCVFNLPIDRKTLCDAIANIFGYPREGLYFTVMGGSHTTEKILEDAHMSHSLLNGSMIIARDLQILVPI